jgi:hypothetical protein
MRGMMSMQQEKKLRKGLNANRWKIANNQILKSRTQDELESVRDELQNLFDFAQCDNVSDFRQIYEEREMQHMQSVSLLEELASNCRKVSEENTQIRQKISRLKAEYNEGHKKVQERREHFQKSLHVLTETSQHLQEEYDESMDVFEDLKPGLQKLYLRWLASLKDSTDMTEKYGTTFHFGNALSILAVLEEKLQEITTRYCDRMEPENACRKSPTSTRTHDGSLGSPTSAAGSLLGSTFDPNNRIVDLRAATKSIFSNVVSRDLPSMHDSSLDLTQPMLHTPASSNDTHDDDEHPLSYEELKHKIYRGLATNHSGQLVDIPTLRH